MKRIISLFALFVLVALNAYVVAAQTTASGQASGAMQASAQAKAPSSTTAKASTSSSANSKKATSTITIAEGTKIDASLVSWLDARRSRVGDPVQARIEQDVKQGGKVVLKKGTQLVGHVTEARTRAGSKGESEVGISFERALLPGDRSIPFHASIVALAAPPSAASASGAGASSAMASGGAMGTTQASAHSATATGATMNTSNATTSTASGTLNAKVRSSGAAGGSTSSWRLSSNSKGVFGLEGLSLGSTKPNAPEGSTIVSTTKNVRLNSGTEMLLRTSAQPK